MDTRGESWLNQQPPIFRCEE